MRILYIALILLFNSSLSYAAAEVISKDHLKAYLTVMSILKQKYVDDVTEKKLVENSLLGMLEGLDPYSEYYNEEEFKELMNRTNAEFGGLGIEFLFEKGIKVVSPIEDTPAYRAGIKTGDYIIAVDDQKVEQMSRTDAVRKMRGDPGTKVKLTIVREGEKKPLDFTITREIIKFPTIKYYAENGTAYVRILSFSKNTTSTFTEAINDLKKQNGGKLNGLIIDVRGNPGGLLDQAIRLCNIFIDDGGIVGIKTRDQKEPNNVMASDAGYKIENIPIITLIDGGSASASEILAGALQDHKKSIIMGTKSFGKGTVQELYKDLPEGFGGFKYTTAHFYTPLGKKIQGQGVTPDIIVKPVEFSQEERAKLQKEGEDIKQPISGRKLSDDLWNKLYKKDNVITRAIDILKSINLLKKK